MSQEHPQHRTRTHRVLHSIAWPGALEFEEGRLRFSPEDADAPAGAVLDVPLGSVLDVRHNGREGLLVIELPEDARARFVGHDLEPVYGLLSSVLSERQAAARPGAGRSAEEHSVKLRSGPIIHRGGLHLDDEGMTYTPRSVLDTLVGIRTRRIQWEDVHRITARSGPIGLVEILHRDGRMVLEPAAPEVLFPALLSRLHALQTRQETDADVRAAVIAACIAARPGIDPPGTDDIATLALHGTADHAFERGVFLVDDRELRFLPHRAASPALTLELATLVRRSGSVRGLPTLRLAAGGDRHTFVPAAGPSTAGEVWARVRAPSRVVPWPELGPRTRARLAEEARFVRLHVDDGATLDVTPVAVFSGSADWTLVCPGLVLEGTAPGARVSVEIGQDEGVYAFDATLAASRQRPEGPTGPAETTLELREPSAVRVYNQRQGYRVGVHLSASARAAPGTEGLPPGERIALKVHDLSIGGCRALSEAPLPVGAALDLRLELPGRTVRAQATVLRREPSDDPTLLPYGLRFDRVAVADEDRIHRFVLDRQRGDLQVPSEDEPSLPDASFR
jgi:hypothetical protein